MLNMMGFLCRYSKDDPFIALTIDIRNHQNLVESLDQFVKGDLLEGANAYHCDKCNKKVVMQLYLIYALLFLFMLIAFFSRFAEQLLVAIC